VTGKSPNYMEGSSWEIGGLLIAAFDSRVSKTNGELLLIYHWFIRNKTSWLVVSKVFFSMAYMGYGIIVPID